MQFPGKRVLLKSGKVCNFLSIAADPVEREVERQDSKAGGGDLLGDIGEKAPILECHKAMADNDDRLVGNTTDESQFTIDVIAETILDGEGSYGQVVSHHFELKYKNS